MPWWCGGNRGSWTMMRSVVVFVTLAAGAFLTFAGKEAHAQAKKWYPFNAEEYVSPVNMGSPVKPVMYTPLERAVKKWNICVSFPHLKDAYWLAVDYGVSEEAKDLGVAIHIVEAGGYTNLAKQISQIEDCASNGAEAIVIGAISLDGLNQTVERLHDKNIPVIDLANGISSKNVTAKSLVSFDTMGYRTGEYIAKLNAKGSPEAEVAWFPGPPGAGWVEDGNRGFNDAIKDSALKIVATKYGDTGKEIQLKLVEDTLQANPNIKYIVGTSPTTEAAVQLLRERNLTDKIKVISYYLTPSVYDNIKAGRVMASPTDSPVVQGRVAIDQAVRVLEAKDYLKHVGPKIYMIDKSNVDSFDYSSSLAPAGWKPVFTVN
jgi:periplasmic protein TorT